MNEIQISDLARGGLIWVAKAYRLVVSVVDRSIGAVKAEVLEVSEDGVIHECGWDHGCLELEPTHDVQACARRYRWVEKSVVYRFPHAVVKLAFQATETPVGYEDKADSIWAQVEGRRGAWVPRFMVITIADGGGTYFYQIIGFADMRLTREDNSLSLTTK